MAVRQQWCRKWSMPWRGYLSARYACLVQHLCLAACVTRLSAWFNGVGAANMVSLLVAMHESVPTIMSMQHIIDHKLAVCAPTFSDYNQASVADVM